MKKLLAILALCCTSAVAFAANTINWPDRGDGNAFSTVGTTCFNSQPTGTETLDNGTQRVEKTSPCLVLGSYGVFEAWTANPDGSVIAVYHLISGLPQVFAVSNIPNPVDPSRPATRTHYHWSGVDADGVSKEVDFYLDSWRGKTVCGGGRGGGCHSILYALPSSYITIQ